MKRKTLILLAAFFTALAALADLPFRNHRYDAFNVLRVDNSSIVFIGNSITNMHDWTTAFDNHAVLNRGNSGAVSDEAISNLESILIGKPAKAFIMIGTNDMALFGEYNKSPEYVEKRVRHILTRFQRESPQTELYVQSVLPSNNSRSLERISAANALLKATAEEMGATYVDLYDDLQGIISGEHSRDRLHLSASGYKIWCDKIAPYVGSACVYPEGVTNQYAGQSAAYDMRISTFAARKVKSTDVLIIGDEMINGGEWHELLGTENARNYGQAWGYAGQTLANMLGQIPYIIAGQSGSELPAAVMLYAGVQEVVGNSVTLESLASQYRSVVSKIKELAPDAKLYLLSHQPTATASINTNRVVPFNDSIKAIASDVAATFVDIYTDFASGDLANTAYFTGNYLWGKGYAAVARKIAPYVPGAAVPTEAETDALYADIAARTALGNAVATAALLPVGDGVGEYAEASMSEVNAAVEAAYALLAADGTTNEAFAAAASELNALLDALSPNMPKASSDGDETWYKLVSTLRDSRYITSTGVGAGVMGEAEHNLATGMWKFVARTDGSFDIVNRDDASFISPAASNNTQVSTVAAQPSAGWTLSAAATTGMFIISSGSAQLNQTTSALGYKLYNWGGGSNTTDAGCQFTIVEAGDPDVVLTELPTPLLVVGETELDGTAPFRVPDAEAEPVLAATDVTVAIDVTAPTASQEGCIVGSVDTTATGSFASVFVNTAQRFGVRYADTKYLFTGPSLGTARTQIVIVMNASEGKYVYYKDGTQTNAITYAGVPSFGTVSNVNALFLGGLVRSDSNNKYPFKGTIHSVQFFPGALTDALVAQIQYAGLVPTGIDEVGTAPTAATAATYDLQGRRVNATAKGVYIVNGKKVIR